MIAPRHNKPKPELELEHERKQRRCLKCRKVFMSDWPGERICPHCKTKGDWRVGRLAT